MCLETVSRVYKKPTGTGMGYKVFYNGPPYTFLYCGDNVTTGKWLTAGNPLTRIRAYDGKRYLAGFHIYATREAAKIYATREAAKAHFNYKYVILRVKYKGKVAVGKENGDTVIIIARKILVYKPRRKK